MKKTTLLSSALAALLLFCTAMAADFHALTEVQSIPTPNQDKKSSATKEKATCNPTIAGNNGGFSLCVFLSPGASSDATSYAITNERPVKAARFIQVVN